MTPPHAWHDGEKLLVRLRPLRMDEAEDYLLNEITLMDQACGRNHTLAFLDKSMMLFPSPQKRRGRPRRPKDVPLLIIEENFFDKDVQSIQSIRKNVLDLLVSFDRTYGRECLSIFIKLVQTQFPCFVRKRGRPSGASLDKKYGDTEFLYRLIRHELPDVPRYTIARYVARLHAGQGHHSENALMEKLVRWEKDEENSLISFVHKASWRAGISEVLRLLPDAGTGEP